MEQQTEAALGLDECGHHDSQNRLVSHRMGGFVRLPEASGT